MRPRVHKSPTDWAPVVKNNCSESQFEAVKMRITEKYKKTEKELLLKFRDASQENNVEQMQQMAETLSRKLFKNYRQISDFSGRHFCSHK